MNTISLVLERVARLDERLAFKLLAWLDSQQMAPPDECPLGARAMIGFALRDGRAPRSTVAWMQELREGDAE